jgi:hypothetical protein
MDDARIIPDEILLISYEPVAVRAPPTNTLPVVTNPINVEVPLHEVMLMMFQSHQVLN